MHLRDLIRLLLHIVYTAEQPPDSKQPDAAPGLTNPPFPSLISASVTDPWVLEELFSHHIEDDRKGEYPRTQGGEGGWKKGHSGEGRTGVTRNRRFL
jgi:hypothetical protein